MEKSLFDDLIGSVAPQKIEEEELIDNNDPKKGPDLEEDEDELEKKVEDDNDPEDERVQVLYDILVDTGLVEKSDEFKPTRSAFEEVLDELPERFFMQAVANLPDHVQELLEFGMTNPQATLEDISKFFERYQQPKLQKEPDTDDEAYEYLKPFLLESKIFPSEQKAQKYLDELLEEGLLLEKAKEVFAERKARIDDEKKAEFERVKLAKQEAEETQKKFYENLFDTVESLDWEKSRKQAVLNNLKPEEVMRKNALIQKSPKAVVQLADIYSYFDEKTGEFDFSELGIRSISKKLQKEKRAIEEDKVSSHLSKLKTKPGGSGGESFWSSFKPTK